MRADRAAGRVAPHAPKMRTPERASAPAAPRSPQGPGAGRPPLDRPRAGPPAWWAHGPRGALRCARHFLPSVPQVHRMGRTVAHVHRRRAPGCRGDAAREHGPAGARRGLRPAVRQPVLAPRWPCSSPRRAGHSPPRAGRQNAARAGGRKRLVEELRQRLFRPRRQERQDGNAARAPRRELFDVLAAHRARTSSAARARPACTSDSSSTVSANTWPTAVRANPRAPPVR